MKCPRRRAGALLALVLATLLCFVLLHACGSRPASDDERCAGYLTSLGWTIDREPVETLSLTLPKTLHEPYESYNELQLRQGYDLRPYGGKTLERRTYTVTNHPSGKPCQADLYLYNGEIVAGDVLCLGENGFIAPLAYPKG